MRYNFRKIQEEWDLIECIGHKSYFIHLYTKYFFKPDIRRVIKSVIDRIEYWEERHLKTLLGAEKAWIEEQKIG